MHSAHAAARDGAVPSINGVQMPPIPVLVALRDHLTKETKDRKNPLTLCDRALVECVNELIAGERLRERRLFQGITGIVPHFEESS